MQRIALALALLLSTSPAFAALKAGTRATDFTTQAVLAGKADTFNLNKALKRGPVVLYFYPKAFTSGCTVEAHVFSEAADDFAAYGASLVGMSADNIDTLKRFSVEACRNKFAVGIATKPMIKDYKVSLPMAGITNRTTRSGHACVCRAGGATELVASPNIAPPHTAHPPESARPMRGMRAPATAVRSCGRPRANGSS